MSRPLVQRLRESRFRGTGLSKLQLASLKAESTFRIVTKGPSMAVPDQLVALRKLAAVSSPSLSAVTVLAHRAGASTEQFYPPQLVEALSLFGQIGHCESNDSLFHLFASRKDDLLNEASPKRIVQLIEAFANLQLPLFHEDVWPEFRAALVSVIPQLKRGIPTVIRSLAAMGCVDTELVHALLVQAECLAGEIELQYFVHAVEAASRVEGVEVPVRQAIDALLNGGRKLTGLQSVEVLTAALRVSHPAAEELKRAVESGLRTGQDLYAQSRVMAAIARHGLTSTGISELVEKALSDVDYKHRMLPHTVLAGALVGGADPTLRLAIEQHILPSADRYSAEKLLGLYRAAAIVGVDAATASQLRELLEPVARQLSVRQQRLLWEVAPGLTPVSVAGNVGGSTETVGPYPLSQGATGDLSIVMPRYQVFRPGSTEVRRDVALRLAAIKAAAGREVRISHS